MTSPRDFEPWIDAVDAMLSTRSSPKPGLSGGGAASEPPDDEASAVAAAFAELRSAYEAVDAPFVFDPSDTKYVRRRLTVRRIGWVAASIGAAAVVALIMFRPDDTSQVVLQPTTTGAVRPDEPAVPPPLEADRDTLPRTPTVLGVRTPRLAILPPVPSTVDDGDAGVSSRSHFRARYTPGLTRIKTARLSTITGTEPAPSVFPKTPSMISKPRRKPHDENSDDDWRGGGSSDRQSVGNQRLG